MTWRPGDRALLRRIRGLPDPDERFVKHYENQEVMLLEDAGEVKCGLGMVRKWYLRFVDPRVVTFDERTWALEPALVALPPLARREIDPQALAILNALQGVKR